MTSKIKIIIVQPQGLGDTIMITPLLRSIKKSFNNCIVRIIVSSEASKSVLDGSLLVDEVVVFNRRKEGFVNHIKLLMDNYNFSPDVFYMSPYTNKYYGQLFSFLSGASIRIGSDKTIPVLGFTHSNPAFDGKHQVDANINLFSLGLSLTSQIRQPYFHLTCEEIAIGKNFFIDNKLQKKLVIGMHFGGDSQNLHKRYPIEKFQVILKNYLNKSKNNIAILFFGPDEDNLADQIETHPRALILRNKPIKFIASIIFNIKLMLTSDSGLGHIASAFNIPTQTIFGPGDIKVYSPYGARNIIIETEKKLSCRPCISSFGYINCEHFECLNSISTKKVLDSMNEAIELLTN